MKKIIFIKQSAGLGDIFFCQKIAKNFSELNKGVDIIWPVLPEFLWIKDYIKIKNVSFVDENSFFEGKEFYNYCWSEVISGINNGIPIAPILLEDNERKFIFIPLEKASYANVSGPIMECKYRMLASSSEGWQDYFSFERNTEKEKALLQKFNIKDGQKFTLINRRYSTKEYNGHIQHKMNLDPSLDVIHLDYIDGYTLFDWCGIFEKASEIHSVGTSINFILEKLNTTDKLFMYKRPEQGASEFLREDFIFKKKYVKIL